MCTSVFRRMLVAAVSSSVIAVGVSALPASAQTTQQSGLVNVALTGNTVHRIHEKKQLQSHLEQAGVTVFANVGDARFVDEHSVVLGDGTTLQAEKFILCVGGHARRR